MIFVDSVKLRSRLRTISACLVIVTSAGIEWVNSNNTIIGKKRSRLLSVVYCCGIWEIENSTDLLYSEWLTIFKYLIDSLHAVNFNKYHYYYVAYRRCTSY